MLPLCKNLKDEDGKKLATQAGKDKQFNEAFLINSHFKLNIDAIKVLIDDLNDFDKALEFARSQDQQDVWKELGRGYLQYGNFAQALETFQKHQVPTLYDSVMKKAPEFSEWEEVVRFLRMS